MTQSNPLYKEIDKLRQQNKELSDVLRKILEHVEDNNVSRVGNQCTLCHTFREIWWQALAKYNEGK